MFRKFTIAAYVLLLLALVPSVTLAQSDKEQDYLKAAEPYMNLSCQALVDTYGDDEKHVEEIIELMIAVSVINRQIDITKLLETDQDKDDFGKYLEQALTVQCEEDVQGLLAGNVDRAVAFAFTDDSDKPKE